MPVRGRNGGNAGNGSKWIRPEKRRRIYARDNWQCVWCGVAVGTPKGEPRPIATLDHVIPRAHGGINAAHNLITACMQCNRERCDATAFLFALNRAICAGPSGLDSSRAERWEAAARILERIVEAIERPLP